MKKPIQQNQGKQTKQTMALYQHGTASPRWRKQQTLDPSGWANVLLLTHISNYTGFFQSSNICLNSSMVDFSSSSERLLSSSLAERRLRYFVIAYARFNQTSTFFLAVVTSSLYVSRRLFNARMMNFLRMQFILFSSVVKS